MQAKNNIFWENERELWLPPEDLSASEWTEKYRSLSSASAEKGPLKLNRTPYLVPFMNKMTIPSIEMGVFCKPAQIAGTEMAISLTGFYSCKPCPIMVVLADEDTSKYIARERIQQMYRSSPELSKLIDESRFNVDEITLKNGAYIAMAWASSVAKLASRPIQVVICDEIDKPGYFVTTKEASPISLVKERTESFYIKKVILLSTPTDETGNIYKYLQICDVIYDWHVPCPHCGVFQPLRWGIEYQTGFEDGIYRSKNGEKLKIGKVEWEGGRNATHDQIMAARYVCGTCGGTLDTIQKNKAVEAGIEVSRQEEPAHPISVGMHVNRLYSLLGKSGDLPKLVHSWIHAQGDPGLLQGFINSTLTEIWVQRLEKKEEKEILQARCGLEPRTVPSEAVALVCSVDVQKRGYWYTVWAFSVDMTGWLIDYGPLPTREMLDDLIFEREYPIDGQAGTFQKIWRAGIDTGGGAGFQDESSTTEATYAWITQNIMRGVQIFGLKGSSKSLQGKIKVGKPLEKTPSGKPMPVGIQIVMMDTHKLKDAVSWRLGLAKDKQTGGMYLHNHTGSDFAQQILAEEKRRTRKGIEWVKIKRDNHYLDCCTMALACAGSELYGGVSILRPKSQQQETNRDKPSIIKRNKIQKETRQRTQQQARW